MEKSMVEQIEACRTKAQVMAILRKNGTAIYKDTSEEVGCFSVWLDETTRVYKPHRSSTMRVQRFTKVKMEYSGIPVYFGD